MSACFTCNEVLFNCNCSGPQDAPTVGRINFEQRHPECGNDNRVSLKEAADGLAKFGKAIYESAGDVGVSSCGEERPADQGVTHEPLRGTLPVWLLGTDSGILIVAAEDEIHARSLTKKICYSRIELDGVFFNGAGPKIIQEVY